MKKRGIFLAVISTAAMLSGCGQGSERTDNTIPEPSGTTATVSAAEETDASITEEAVTTTEITEASAETEALTETETVTETVTEAAAEETAETEIQTEEVQSSQGEDITIQGVRYPAGLTELSLELDTLTGEEIAAIGSLTGLTKLDLCLNKYADDWEYDLSPLGELTALKELSLEDMYISDLGFLSGLTKLEELSLAGSGFFGMDALRSHESLRALDLSNAEFSDSELDILTELTYLEELDISQCYAAEKLDFLKSLTDLKKLHISSRYMFDTGYTDEDLRVLQELPQLEELDIEFHENESMDFLKEMTGLKGLKITARDRADDITENVSALTGLEALDLSDTGLEDIGFIGNLADLKRLCLSHNEITDIGVLAGLTGLEELDISHNGSGIDDISVLSHLKELRSLSLYNCNVSDYTPISGLTKLRYLMIGCWLAPEIESLDFLSGMTELEELNIGESIVTGANVLGNLTNLKNLSCYSVSFDDHSFIRELTNLQTLSLGDLTFDYEQLRGVEFPNIENLNLFRSSITDLSVLSGFKNVKYLDLRESGFRSNFDITPLYEFTEMRSVQLFSFEAFPEDQQREIDKLKEALPYCRFDC